VTESHTGQQKRGAVRIIADHGDPEKYRDRRVCVSLNARWARLKVFESGPLRWIKAVALGLKCWWTSLRYPRPLVLVTYGHEHGFVVAFLQYLASIVLTPRTHVMFDLLLHHRRTGLAGLFDAIKMYIFARVVDRAAVWGPPDIDAFAEDYGIPPSIFRFVPFHTTVEGFNYTARDGGYIFAGGNSQRDYRTLIEAMRTIDCPVFIATTLPGIARIAADCPHITVRGVSPEEFRKKMAGCTLFIECHLPGELRTVGHQSFLNAMYLGKPGVLADCKSAVGYLTHELNALVVAAGDVEGVRNATERLLHDHELARRLAEA